MFGSHHAEFEAISARVALDLHGVDLNDTGGLMEGESEGAIPSPGGLAVGSLAHGDVELLCEVHAAAFSPGTVPAPGREVAVAEVLDRSAQCARCVAGGTFISSSQMEYSNCCSRDTGSSDFPFMWGL